MTPPDSDRAWPWVRYFLEHYLTVQRGARANTVASYRIAFRQLRRFLYQEIGRRAAQDLTLADLEPQRVLRFLTWLQSSEGGQVGTSTRNARLAALRSFFRCLQLYCTNLDPSHWERLRHLPEKRAPRHTVHHFEVAEINHLFRQIDLSKREGLRDLALLALLYNTGARASEAAGLRRTDLRLGDLAAARFRCKGGRQLACPLWPSTARILKTYLDATRTKTGPVFLNQRGAALTRHGIHRRVSAYLAKAAQSMPALRDKDLSTHSFRHTTAIHLLESGADMHVIKAWLGHSSTRSTDHYLALNLQKQRDLLARFSPPVALQQIDQPAQETDDWLDAL